MGFRPLSTRLDGASKEIGAGLSVVRFPYGRFASGAAPRHRDTVAPEPPMTRAMEDTDSPLSRARRAFARRGVLRVASFR